MKTTHSFIQRNSIAIFALLAYLISWSIVLPTHGLILSWGPMLAALIVVRLTQGRTGVSNLWKRVTYRGVGLGWYILGMAIPMAITLATVGLNLSLGAKISQGFDWSASLRGLQLLLIVGGHWEEPGWTGYALPRLLKRFENTPYGAFAAALVVAGIRTAWHLPLMLYGHIYWSDILLNVAFQVIVTWLYIKRNSVLQIMLIHLVNNCTPGQIGCGITGCTRSCGAYWPLECSSWLSRASCRGINQECLNRSNWTDLWYNTISHQEDLSYPLIRSKIVL
jgi:membrane protease YdiL (CAAX protease family)